MLNAVGITDKLYGISNGYLVIGKMNQISLNPHNIIRWLVAVVFILIVASCAGQLALYFSEYAEEYRFVKFFNVDAEGNIPTYFSVLLTLVAAPLLVIITILET